MPAARHLLRFIWTYVAEAASPPTSTAARHGGRPAARANLRARSPVRCKSLCEREAPSMSCAADVFGTSTPRVIEGAEANRSWRTARVKPLPGHPRQRHPSSKSRGPRVHTTTRGPSRDAPPPRGASSSSLSCSVPPSPRARRSSPPSLAGCLAVDARTISEAVAHSEHPVRLLARGKKTRAVDDRSVRSRVKSVQVGVGQSRVTSSPTSGSSSATGVTSSIRHGSRLQRRSVSPGTPSATLDIDSEGLLTSDGRSDLLLAVREASKRHASRRPPNRPGGLIWA